MRKKLPLTILIVTVLLIAGVAIISAHFEKPNNSFVNEQFYGEIISYEDTEDGLVFVLDVRGNISHTRFLITDSTMYSDSEIEQAVMDHVTGKKVIIISEFWTQDSLSTYPATLIQTDEPSPSDN